MLIHANIATAAALLLLTAASSWTAAPARFKRVVFGSATADIAEFEQFAARARQSGATHISISSGLPRSYWQYDTPGDPYPAWVISNAGLLKTAIPKQLEAYLPRESAEKVLTILETRCKVLRRLRLKAAINMCEPQMLPEAVFADHPLWRGPRVDQPNRSRVARFAPTVDNPEVLALYRESVSTLLRRCPEIEMLSLFTNDSGSGLDWSGGLYSGRFGNTLYQRRAMDERLRGFFSALQEGARDAGGSLEIDMVMTREPEPSRIAARLTQGMAIENVEGPDATPYKAGASSRNPFHPVVGIPQPVRFVEGLERAAESTAPRLVISMDRLDRELYFAMYDHFWRAEIRDPAARLAFLKNIAASQAGPDKAGELLSLWLNLHEAARFVPLLDSGGTIFELGCVHQRWLTRPFVPFPAELKPEEKDYYRKFQFQARTEEHAENLADLQASDVYTGWSGRHHVHRILREMESHIEGASRIAEGLKGPGYAALRTRLEVFSCIMKNARNAVSYQAQLDRVRRLGFKPEPSPVVGTQSGWDRQLLLETARAEIDNTALLMKLLGSSAGELLELAPSKDEEDIRVLGPDLIDQLRRKIGIMNSHWEDYKRMFTTPNL